MNRPLSRFSTTRNLATAFTSPCSLRNAPCVQRFLAAQHGLARRRDNVGQRDPLRAHNDVTLANPVGLCIDGLSVGGWTTLDGSDPFSYWQITRGAPKKALRKVYEVPAGKGFVVGDIKISGRPIEFGAQIADFITIRLTGLATRLGKSTVRPVDGCAQPLQQFRAFAQTASVASILGSTRDYVSRR